MSIDLNTMPKLGFGLMRLPEKDGEIDHEQVCSMVDKYMQSGMNYFDTAYVYHGGKSEVAAREALVKRYPRDSFMLATSFRHGRSKRRKMWRGCLMSSSKERALRILTSICCTPSRMDSIMIHT